MPDNFLGDIFLRNGRDFDRNDVAGGESVAIVSQDLADTYYGGHALDKVVNVPHVDGAGVWPLRITGVVGATFQRGALQPLQPVIYVPLAQVPTPMMAIFRHLEPLRFALRGHGNPMDWQAGVRAARVAPMRVLRGE